MKRSDRDDESILDILRFHSGQGGQGDCQATHCSPIDHPHCTAEEERGSLCLCLSVSLALWLSGPVAHGLAHDSARESNFRNFRLPASVSYRTAQSSAPASPHAIAE